MTTSLCSTRCVGSLNSHHLTPTPSLNVTVSPLCSTQSEPLWWVRPPITYPGYRGLVPALPPDGSINMAVSKVSWTILIPLGVKREPHCVNTSTMSNETANSTPSLRICNCLLRLPTLLWPTRIETWWPNFSMHWNSTRFEIVSLAPLNSDLVAQKNKPQPKTSPRPRLS